MLLLRRRQPRTRAVASTTTAGSVSIPTHALHAELPHPEREGIAVAAREIQDDVLGTEFRRLPDAPCEALGGGLRIRTRVAPEPEVGPLRERAGPVEQRRVDDRSRDRWPHRRPEVITMLSVTT